MIAVVVFFLAYCLALSVAARREWPWMDRYLPNALLFAGFWTQVIAMGPVFMSNGIQPLVAMLAVMLLAGFGAMLGMRYVTHLVTLVLDTGARAISGADRLPPHPRFDKGDKAIIEKRYDDAVRIYLESAEGVPADPEPLRRAGEATILGGDLGAGLDRLRRALVLTKNPEDRASLGFRIAELLERRQGRPGDARDLLVSLAGELKGTRFEAYARERLERIS